MVFVLLELALHLLGVVDALLLQRPILDH
eukprot:COSAG02_NODE_66683_length_254_cov_15.968839_1_plen_28_part_10